MNEVARVHDFRSLYWGHNLMIRHTHDNMMRGSVISEDKINAGDKLVWITDYGTATGRVIDSEWVSDPGDMYHVTVEVVLREGHNGEVLWPVEEQP